MQVSREVIGSWRHREKATCRSMHAQKVQYASAAASVQAMGRRFRAYGTDELRQVKVFKYLGCMVSSVDKDVPAMLHNLKQARKVWARFLQMLAQEAASAPVVGMFYQAVVAAVLLYGYNPTWSRNTAYTARLNCRQHRNKQRRSLGIMMRPIILGRSTSRVRYRHA